MDWFTFARWLHVIGACVLLGTGAGIAFFMMMAHRTNSAALVAHVAGTVVVADLLFTATAVVVQPLTGVWLASIIGWPLGTPWIVTSLALYALIGVFWLPVVWLQLQMRNLARTAAAAEEALPPAYYRYYRLWFAAGFPAFAAVLLIVWLMLERPALW